MPRQVVTEPRCFRHLVGTDELLSTFLHLGSLARTQEPLLAGFLRAGCRHAGYAGRRPVLLATGTGIFLHLTPPLG